MLASDGATMTWTSPGSSGRSLKCATATGKACYKCSSLSNIHENIPSAWGVGFKKPHSIGLISLSGKVSLWHEGQLLNRLWGRDRDNGLLGPISRSYRGGRCRPRRAPRGDLRGTYNITIRQ